MKKDFSDRIKEAMDIRGIRQAELSEITKIDKGSLSSYMSGKYKPRQNNIYLLAKTLDVNEAWLMGYDVPMERTERSIEEEIGEEHAIENYFKTLGWTCKQAAFIEGLNCEECIDRQAVAWGAVPEDQYPDGNYKPFCEHCKLESEYCTFTNGNISFSISHDDYKLLRNNIRNFVKNQIQLLFRKSTENLFDDIKTNE